MALAKTTAERVRDWYLNYPTQSGSDTFDASGTGVLAANKTPPVNTTGLLTGDTSASTASTGDPDANKSATFIPDGIHNPDGSLISDNPFNMAGAPGNRLTPIKVGDWDYVAPPPATTTTTTNTPPPTTTTTTTPTTPAASTTPTTTASSTSQGILNANGSTTINPAALTQRVIDPATETVEGRMNGMLTGNNPFVQGFRDRAQRAAGARGLANSALAATGGEEAAANAAFQVANPDAAAYQTAAAYNTALANQALMYNVDTQNQYQLQANTIEGQKAVANIHAAATIGAAGIAAAAQLTVASLNAENARWIAQLTDARSRYNTDEAYKDAELGRRQTIANNIIQNMDMDPAYKAEQLRALGFPALAAAIYTPDPELSGHVNGDTSTYQGQTYVYQDGAWVLRP